jgi:hypothetical protein
LCIVSDQTSEAGNVKYCTKLHARCGLRCLIRVQKDASVVPISALGWTTDTRKYGRLREGWIPCSLELLTMRTYEETVGDAKLEEARSCASLIKTARVAIDSSISGSRNT